MKDRNWLEIDINAIRQNILLAKSHVKDKKVIGIVKADCYGLGSQIAKYCQDLLDGFGVASISEGEELRKEGITKDILLLGGFFMSEENIKRAIDNNLDLSVSDFEQVKKINKFCEKENKKACIQIAVDSGMGRWGFDINDDISKLFDIKNICIKGIFSHLVMADEKDDKLSASQLKKFEQFCTHALIGKDFEGNIHILNSAGIFRYPDTFGNAVRLGIAMYGCPPSEIFEKLPLKNCARWYARIIDVKSIKEGEGISYGWTFIAKRPMNVASIAIGYADGLQRSLSGILKVYYKGKAYPILGRICMDQCVVGFYDDLPKEGDIVEIIGEGNTFQSMANLSETINYEIISRISKRTEKYYYNI